MISLFPRVGARVDPKGKVFENFEFNPNAFKFRHVVLKRYLDGKLDRDVQALYAFQHLMHKMEHPNSELLKQ